MSSSSSSSSIELCEGTRLTGTQASARYHAATAQVWSEAVPYCPEDRVFPCKDCQICRVSLCNLLTRLFSPLLYFTSERQHHLGLASEVSWCLKSCRMDLKRNFLKFIALLTALSRAATEMPKLGACCTTLQLSHLFPAGLKGTEC